MKMITLHESDWKLARIDSLVKEGVFSSRAELYRAGALMMMMMSEAPKYAKLDKLDSDLFGKEIKVCLDGLRTNSYEIAIEKLKEISDTLKLRAAICPLINDPNKDIFLTLADTMKKYSELVLKFTQFDKEERNQIIDEVQRELLILLEYLKLSEEDLINESESQKPLPNILNAIYLDQMRNVESSSIPWQFLPDVSEQLYYPEQSMIQEFASALQVRKRPFGEWGEVHQKFFRDSLLKQIKTDSNQTTESELSVTAE